MRRIAQCLAPLAALLAVEAVGFHRLIENPSHLIVDGERPSLDHAYRGRTRAIGNDLTSVFLPRFLYVAEHVNTWGRAPSWDALGFGGRPLVGNPQAGGSYPPLWLAWKARSPGGLGWLTAAHLVWAGLGVYALTRVLGFGRSAATLAGVCYEAAPYLIAHTFEGHYPHVWAACWYPWAFWALTIGLRGSPVGLLALPVALAATFLTGHPQEWYYLVVVMTVWVGFEAWRVARESGRREAWRPLTFWVAAVGLSVGLCAVDMVPQLAAGGSSLKAGAASLTHANRYRVHSSNLMQLLSPFSLGGPQDYRGEDNYWETVLSIGLAPLALAALGLFGHPERATVRRWGVLVAATVVFAGGRALGLYSVMYAILPGMNRFRVPARTLFLASLGASVLAGAGVDRILRAAVEPATWPRARRRLLAGLGVVAAALIAARATHWLGACGTSRELVALWRAAAEPAVWWAVAGTSALVWLGRSPRGAMRAAIGLGVVAAVELAIQAQSLIVCAPASAFLGDDPAGRAIRADRGDLATPARIATFGTVYPDLNAAALGFEKTNVNDGFQLQHAADLYQRLYPLLDPARPKGPTDGPMDTVVEERRGRVGQAVLDLMAVDYLVSDRALPLPNFEPLATGSDGLSVWKNRSALPRAYVTPRAVVVAKTKVRHAPRVDDLTPRDGVLMARDPLAGTGPNRQPFTTAEWSSPDPDEAVVRVTTAAPGLLVVASTWMPGWTATVDGRPAQVERGNHWQQVVALPEAGAHEVVLRYVPPGLATGTFVSAAAFVAWGAWGVLLAVRRVGALRFDWGARPAPAPARRPAWSAYRSA
jgi:hypothetical protein